jgi:hypothetical protein
MNSRNPKIKVEKPHEREIRWEKNAEEDKYEPKKLADWNIEIVDLEFGKKFFNVDRLKAEFYWMAAENRVTFQQYCELLKSAGIWFDGENNLMHFAKNSSNDDGIGFEEMLKAFGCTLQGQLEYLRRKGQFAEVSDLFRKREGAIMGKQAIEMFYQHFGERTKDEMLNFVLENSIFVWNEEKFLKSSDKLVFGTK